MLKKRWIIGVAIGLLVLAGGAYYGANAGVNVATITVTEEAYSDVITEDGTIVTDYEYWVVPQVSGIVENVFVDEGQVVESGQVLLRVNTEEQKLKLEQLKGRLLSLQGQLQSEKERVDEDTLIAQEIQLQILQTDLLQVQRHYEKTKALHEAGAVSAQVFEDAESALENAKNAVRLQEKQLNALAQQNMVKEGTESIYAGQLQEIRASIELVQRQIDKGTLKAQQEGVIADLQVKEGMFIAPPSQAMRIVDVENVHVESLVLSEDIQRMQVGDKVRVVQKKAGEDSVYYGEISKVGKTAIRNQSTLGLEEKRVNVHVAFRDRSTEQIVGADVDVSFIRYQDENGIVLPKDAVFEMEAGEYVWTVVDGMAVQKSIASVHESRGYVLVEGLKSGETIVAKADVEGIDEGVSVHASNNED